MYNNFTYFYANLIFNTLFVIS